MVKFEEAENRLFRGKFACKKCKAVTKTSIMKIIDGKSRCKKCNSKALRPLRKK